MFFIFKDEEVEQDYLLKRQLGIIRDYDPNLSLVKINEQKEKTKEATRIANLLARAHSCICSKTRTRRTSTLLSATARGAVGFLSEKASNAASSLFHMRMIFVMQ